MEDQIFDKSQVQCFPVYSYEAQRMLVGGDAGEKKV
jgi:hypothetical protein